MCETSEPGERLFSKQELLPIGLEIGQRILELFGYREISIIVYRLKTTSNELNAVVDGERMPSAELLLGIRKATGASIDWLLTGEGQKYAAQNPGITLSQPGAATLVFSNRNSEIAIANQ